MRSIVSLFATLFAWLAFLAPATAAAQPDEPRHGGEASLILPDLSSVEVLGMSGHSLLMFGILVAFGGIAFGVIALFQVKNLPTHSSMAEVSDIIWETCKTYLITQGKFLMILEALIGAIIVLYFGFLQGFEPLRVLVILAFSVIGILGSYGVAWFGIRINTYANSRTAFASLEGKPYPVYAIPLKAGMSIGMLLISVELVLMLGILLFVPGEYAGPCFIGFAIGESLGASALRIAGGIFTKIADIGSDLMKIVFKVKEDDARNPGVIADCTGDNAGDSVGPSADGFETYGVTGVALISFILLAVTEPVVQVQLLVWIFAMRIVMVIASALSYLGNEAVQKATFGKGPEVQLRAPADLAGLDHLDRLRDPDLRRLRSAHPRARRRHPVVEALGHHQLRHPGRRHHSRGDQGLHLHRVEARERSRHRLARRRRLAEHPLGPHRRQLQRLLDGPGDRDADGPGLLRSACSAWAI